MLASSRTHFCQVFYVQTNIMLENLAFPDYLSSVFLIFIIFSEFVCFEMNLPSVASCDSARTHPPFLASSRPAKDLRNEPWFFYYVKYINSIRKSPIFDPFQGGPLWTYFLSEIRLLDVSHSRRTNLDVYRICGCSAFTLPHIIKLFQNPMRDFSHFRRTYVDIYRISA